MNLPDRLISWAQNEEMIDSYFLGHGRDCLEAAALLQGVNAPYRLHRWGLFFVIFIAVSFLVGGVIIYNLYDKVGALQAENTRLLTQTCTPAKMETPTIIQRDWKVIG